MKIKTRLYLNTTICSAGIIGIALFSLVTIQMIRDKITVLTSRSTPLQVKTVQMQQTVEKLSADLLQIGLASDPQEVRAISATIDAERTALEKLHADVSAIKHMPLETAVFSELHTQIVNAADEKFRSMAVFREEASRVNGAMARVDKALIGLREIIAGLVSTASRRAATATKTLNETLSDKSAAPDILANVQNFRNEVDVDIELNKKINAINDIVYAIGVDAKLLDAKARLIMLSSTPQELDRATAEAQAVQARINRNVALAGARIREIKNSGFVDDTMNAITGAVGSVGASFRTIAASQRKVLDSMSFVDASVKKVKQVAIDQARKSEQQVRTTAEEQQQFVKVVGTRVEYFKRLLVAISLLIVAAALLISITTMVCINRSLKRMTDTFSSIVETGDFTRSASIKNDDEFGITIRAFNKLVSLFTGIIAAVSASSRKLALSSRGLSGTAQEIHTTIGSQTVRIGQVAAASMQMAQTVTLISTNTASIAQASDEARSIAANGAEVVAMTGAEVQEIAQVVEEATRVMNELRNRSQQVGEIVDVIVEITDQTNLLALNAAIEAARAGDHGRGFAVVADEVRKLATSTAEATVGITERIKSIQADTETAVGTMARSLERVSRGVDYSRQAGDSLHRIVESVSHLQEMTREISVATTELSKVSDEITADIAAIERSSAATVQAAAHVADESDRLALLSVELQDEISRYSCHGADDPRPDAGSSLHRDERLERLGLETTARPMKLLASA
jgi:methyl-accepting chemotaxis protein